MSALGHKIDINLLGATGGDTTYYIPAPFDLIVKDVKVACSADPGDNETLTLTENGVAIGVVAMGTTIAAGAVGTYTPDATYGETKIDAGDVIKIVISTLTAAAVFSGSIIVDPYCRATQTSS